jgi:hypothetical protein
MYLVGEFRCEPATFERLVLFGQTKHGCLATGYKQDTNSATGYKLG